MRLPGHLPVIAGTIGAFAVAARMVLPDYFRVRASDALAPFPTRAPILDPLTMALLSIGASTAMALLAVIFTSYVRREAPRVIGGLSAPFILGYLSTVPVYRYVYSAFPDADHVSIPGVYRWSGFLAVATALVICGLLRLWLTPSTTITRTSPPEA
jgi:hypothetical protein